MEEKTYLKPELEVIVFDCDDIIRTSAGIGTDGDDWPGDNFGE